MIFISYLILAFLVVFLSIYLSRYVDALDKKTEISGAFIGGVMLAGVTSLPELFTSITSIAINSPGLVQGNVFGSNAFNFTIIGICLLIWSEEYRRAKISKSYISTIMFIILLFVICLLGVKYPYCFEIGAFNIEWSSAVIIIFYALNIKLMGDDESQEENSIRVNLSLGRIVSGFIVFSIMLVIVSVILTNVTDKISERYNLGATIAGALFLGIATSLPEFAASVNLVRIGNFNAAFGNIVGSNMFNFTILAFGDIIYKKGGVLSMDGKPNILIASAVISAIFAAISIYTKRNRIFVLLMGLGIIASYILSIVLSV